MSSKTKLLRILEIMKKTDERNPLTIPEILKKLKLYGIEAERKSVSRDIQSLIDSGYSITSAGKQTGFYMTDHDFEDYELKIIADAVCSAKFITKSDSMNLFQRLKRIATPTGEKILSDMLYLDEDIKTDNTYSKYTIDIIIEAIKNNKKIRFQYFDFNSNYERVLKRDGHIYRVSPYYLVWREEEYFLLGNPDSHSNLTHFQISMMIDTAITDETRRNKNDISEFRGNFSLGNYIKENINMYTGAIVHVTVKCDKCMLREVQRKFGKSIHMTKLDEFQFKIVIRVTENDGLYQWLMQYGKSVEVLSPSNIRERLKQLFYDAYKKHDNQGGIDL